MQSKKKLNDEIQLVNVLGNLIKTYEEVYMLKMYRTRNSVLNTRDYYIRILNLYKNIKQSYKNESSGTLTKRNSKLALSVLKKPKTQVFVFVSGNDRFAGEINNKIFSNFIEQYKTSKSDLVVIGQIGKNLMKQRASRLKYQYFDLEEDFGVSTSKQLQPIVEYLIEYSDVRMFYGKFENMVSQVPVSDSITGEMGTVVTSSSMVEQAQEGIVNETHFDNSYFLSEPSLHNILIFFETQIFNSLFKRGVEEATLAQIGARVASLEKSTYEIDKKVKLLNYMNLKGNKYIKNRKQQEILVGIKFWEGQNAG